MKVDFDNSDQIADFVTVPAGTYMCRVVEVREKQSRAGDTMWSICLLVTEGEFTGRMAAWDNLVFSNRGLSRVKMILRCMGLPADGKVELCPDDLMNQEVFVTVRPAEYHSPEGVMTRRNEVAYDGYRGLADAPAEESGADKAPSEVADGSDEELPF